MWAWWDVGGGVKEPKFEEQRRPGREIKEIKAGRWGDESEGAARRRTALLLPGVAVWDGGNGKIKEEAKENPPSGMVGDQQLAEAENGNAAARAERTAWRPAPRPQQKQAARERSPKGLIVAN